MVFRHFVLLFVSALALAGLFIGAFYMSGFREDLTTSEPTPPIFLQEAQPTSAGHIEFPQQSGG